MMSSSLRDSSSCSVSNFSFLEGGCWTFVSRSMSSFFHFFNTKFAASLSRWSWWGPGTNSASAPSLSQRQWLTAFSSAWELKSFADLGGLLVRYTLTSCRRTLASNRDVTSPEGSSSDFFHCSDDRDFGGRCFHILKKANKFSCASNFHSDSR